MVAKLFMLSWAKLASANCCLIFTLHKYIRSIINLLVKDDWRSGVFSPKCITNPWNENANIFMILYWAQRRGIYLFELHLLRSTTSCELFESSGGRCVSSSVCRHHGLELDLCAGLTLWTGGLVLGSGPTPTWASVVICLWWLCVFV